MEIQETRKENPVGVTVDQQEGDRGDHSEDAKDSSCILKQGQAAPAVHGEDSGKCVIDALRVEGQPLGSGQARRSMIQYIVQ